MMSNETVHLKVKYIASGDGGVYRTEYRNH